MFTNMAKNLNKGENLVGKMYIGTVEDNMDPKKMGRVRVRIEYLFGTSDDVPTTDLPWWDVKLPVGLGARGDSSSFAVPEINSTVTIMFPYEDVNFGIVDGIIRSEQQIINQTNRISKEEPAKAVPPFNRVDKTESGDWQGRELNTGASMSSFDDWKQDSSEDYPESYGWIDKIGNWFKTNKTKKTIEFVHSSGSKFKIDQEGNAMIHITGNLKMFVEGDYHTEVTNGGHIYTGARYTRVSSTEETQVGAQTVHRSVNDNKINAANIKLNC